LVLATSLAALPAWGDVPPPNLCMAPGQPCFVPEAGPPGRVCQESICSRPTGPYPDAIMTYPCNLCLPVDGGTDADGGDDSGGGGAGGGAGTGGSGGANTGGAAGLAGGGAGTAGATGGGGSGCSGCGVGTKGGSPTWHLIGLGLALTVFLRSRRARAQVSRR
jgi:hypothetical protein